MTRFLSKIWRFFSVEGILEALRREFTTLSETVDELDLRVDLLEASRDFTIEGLDSQGREISNHAEKFLSISQEIERLKTAGLETQTQLADKIGRIAELTNQLQRSLDKISQTVQDITTSINQIFQRSDSLREEGQAELQKFRGETKEAFQDFFNAGEAVRKRRLTEIGQEVSNLVRQIVSAIRGKIEEVVAKSKDQDACLLMIQSHFGLTDNEVRESAEHAGVEMNPFGPSGSPAKAVEALSGIMESPAIVRMRIELAGLHGAQMALGGLVKDPFLDVIREVVKYLTSSRKAA